MESPKVNIELWQSLPQNAQSNKANYQYIQQFLSQGLVAQAKLAA